MDRDEGAVPDDYIGEFDTSVTADAKEAESIGSMFRRDRGISWLKHPKPTPPHPLDGSTRYSRHFSPTVGRFAHLDKACLYPTWKMTSSDYMRDGSPPMLRPAASAPPPAPSLPPTFPEPARYVPLSVEGQYVPMENPSYAYGYNPNSGCSYGHEGGSRGPSLPAPTGTGTGTSTGSPSRVQFDVHSASAPPPLLFRVGNYSTPPGTGSPSRA